MYSSHFATNLAIGHNSQELRLNTFRILADAAELLETELIGRCTAYEKLRVMLAPAALLQELGAPSEVVEKYTEAAKLFAHQNKTELMSIINPYIIRNVLDRNDKPDRHPSAAHDISNEIKNITSIQQKRMGYLAPLIYMVAEGINNDPAFGTPDPVCWALRSFKTDVDTVSFAVNMAIEAGYPSNMSDLKSRIDCYEDYLESA